MPTRKPSTPEGRKLKRKVNSKDVKLKRNKIVEKTSTGKKKTIQRKGKPVKTVEIKKVTTRKSPILKKKSSSNSYKSGDAFTTASGVAGAAAGYKMAKNATKGLRVGENTRTQRIGEKTTISDAMSKNRKPNPQPAGKMPKNPRKYTGSRNSNAAMGKAMGVVGGAIVGTTTSIAGRAAVSAIKKSLSKSRKVTKRQRTVNGVNKTAQRQNVKAGMKTMRSKKRGSKR